jgi:hypothetical protein
MNSQLSHKDLLEELIVQIQDKEVPFYRCSAQLNYYGWHVLVVLTIVISATAALIAALAPEDKLKEPWIRGLLIGLPIAGTTVTTFLRTLNLHVRERNREIGLIEAERLLRTARSMQGQCGYRKRVQGSIPEGQRHAGIVVS